VTLQSPTGPKVYPKSYKVYRAQSLSRGAVASYQELGRLPYRLSSEDAVACFDLLSLCRQPEQISSGFGDLVGNLAFELPAGEGGGKVY
jgi:hypothetical protein